MTTSLQLSWSHYQELLAIEDDQQRLSLQQAIVKNGLTIEEVRTRKKVLRLAAGPSGPGARGEDEAPARTVSGTSVASKLAPLKGKLYTCQIIKPKVLLSGNEAALVVDLGFSVVRNVEAKILSAFAVNDVVESRPKEDAYRFFKGDRTVKDLYTYNALVERVIDGDTIKVSIDLGFDTWVRESLRLRGIDCPELGTKAGDAAKAFVQSLIKEADRIILRSSRSDKYGRYVADIFILSEGTGAEGVSSAQKADGEIYLNGLLLDKGFAKRYE